MDRSPDSLSVELLRLFKESTMEKFVELLHEIASERGANVPDSELLVTFVKCGYMLGTYISAYKYITLGNGYVKEGEDILRWL